MTKPKKTTSKRQSKPKHSRENAQKKQSSPDAPSANMPDPVELARTLADVYQRAQPVFQSFMNAYSNGTYGQDFDPMNVSEAYTKFMEGFLSDPEKLWKAQTDFWTQWMTIWQESALKAMGEPSKDVIEPEKGDRRFRAPEWSDNALFDFLKQSYLLTARWMEDTVRDSQGLDDEQKEKLAFYTRLYIDALSPTNFVMTNPEVIKETISTGGENLVKGLKNLIEDLERGHGELQISTTNYEAFELGKNIATTPGRVVYQNDLMQLIQYTPTTENAFQTPLLIIPPWINKYYILDLREDNSFIKWAVDQGHTVFTISWVNPTEKLAKKRFEDYMSEGILDALDQIKDMTGEKDCNAVGYCLGGTLLATTLAYLRANKQETRIKSATFLTTLLDFEHAGQMKLFLDDTQIEMMDKMMAEKGIFQGKELQKTFSLLRANDLIWSFVVNNYLMGREPFPFDLLYWNDDSTNMPAAMHSFYLRNMYRDNKLTEAGGIEMAETPIDLKTVTTPAYFLSTKEDHIAPWRATYEGSRLLGGPVTFTLAASGHIAGVVNPPARNKYCYWEAGKMTDTPDTWLEKTQEHDGSWWPHWQKWMNDFVGKTVNARPPAKGLEPAPGSYVRVKS